MDHRLIEGLMTAIAPVIRDATAIAIERATAPLLSRIADLEAGLSDVGGLVSAAIGKVMAELPKPVDGKSVTIDEVRPLLEDMIAALPKPQDGKSVDPAEVAELVNAEIGKAVAALPQPADGKDGTDADPAAIRLMVAEEIAKIPPATDGKDADPELIARLIDEAVANIPTPADGKDADPQEVARLITAEVEKAVAALPAPADGKSITVDDVQPRLEQLVADAVAALPKAKDGVGVAGAVIDRNGILVLTLSDGATKELGVVVGKDADRAEIARVISDEVAKFPPPKDGKDGFGFDDLSVTHDGERKFTLCFSRGDEVKEFAFDLAIPLDRGVWREQPYAKGDGVTHGGSFWIAQCDTTGMPDVSRDWRLAAKRGRAGKDGAPGKDGARGPDGKPGRDGTKW